MCDERRVLGSCKQLAELESRHDELEAIPEVHDAQISVCELRAPQDYCTGLFTHTTVRLRYNSIPVYTVLYV